MSQFLLLEQIDNPSDLKKLTQTQLHQLSKELREFILYKVSKTGGHLASNLGSVELTVALHYVYNTPEDLLVWDVGHQSYAHKILTKRRKLMDTLRQFDGIGGFPKRDESPYDTFGVGHSSTSISAALGMSVANQYQNKTNKAVAIIGDGSMTAGLAFEGLNNAGWLDSDILVILNDNEMSISENVGAISRYLSHVLASRFYNSVKSMANQALGLIPPMQQIAHKVEEHVKGMLIPSTMFEELGFNYIGPIDGHDIDQLVNTLRQIRELSGPQFLHVVTTKGQGYKLAEDSPIEYHGVSKFNLDEGMPSLVDVPKMTYTQVFSKWLLDLAKLEKNFVAITPAMREGSGMVDFARLYPKQFFDVGIAEQHAITFAAGIATQGIKAVVAIYSTFLQRGYDQLIHDVALQNLPVMFAIDRAGIVGADGPTHIGAFDLSYLNCIPNMVVMAPSDENECYHMLWTAYKSDKPTAVRYPRGSGAGVAIVNEEIIHYEIGRGSYVRNGEKIAILAFGSMVQVAVEVANILNATVCNMRFIKPLDVDLIQRVSLAHDYIVTIEENVIIGGAGSRCMQVLQDLGILKPTLNLGLPDEFIPHGDIKVLFKLCGLDKDGIIAKINTFVNKVRE